MTRLACLFSLLLVAGCDLDLSGLGACEDSRDFSDEISATGLTELLADAGAGNLRIEGRSGINEVRVRAHACASDRRTVDDIDFSLERSGSRARVISYIPAYDNARLDLVIEVPTDFDVEIYDGSGNMDVEDVFSVWVFDESGDIDISNIETDVIIDEDGSGDIEVDNVGGDFVVLRDRSGRIDYRNVRGRVEIP